MKLIIQIPCFNEAETLPQTLRDLPRTIPGVDSIEILVVDDGSSDATVQTARDCGVKHILSLGTNRGLARAFAAGIERAVGLGADIVVNTDADNQYCGADIAELVRPILLKKADLVVGCRPILSHPEFGRFKKFLQRAGSWMLRQISKTTVRDAASGFRAFSRDACKRLYIHSRFSYCMETLIQAGNSGLRVTSVDIRVNRATRPSRLFRSVPEYLWKSGSTMGAMFILYRPGRFFGILSGICLASAFIIGMRYIYLIYLFPPEAGTKIYHIPSLILASIFALAGVILAALGIIGELIRALRSQLDEVLFQSRTIAAKHLTEPTAVPAEFVESIAEKHEMPVTTHP